MNLFLRFRHRAGFVVMLLLLFGGFASGQQVAPFKAGDRIIFMGNSITDGGHYHSYIWLYYMTHFPDMRISVLNAGIGGDVCKQMFERLDSEVFAKNPTIMTFLDSDIWESTRQAAAQLSYPSVLPCLQKKRPCSHKG